VVAIADVSPVAAETLGHELGCAAESGSEALVARPDVDVVVVATPNHTHVEPTIQALTAGKDVFVEKPMALHAVDCARMLAAAEAADRRVLVGHIIRLYPAVREMKMRIEAGEIGEPILGRAVLARWADFAEAPANWWKLNPTLSGGELLHEIHHLDLLCWLMGEVNQVDGRFANLAHSQMPAYPDVTQLALRFSNGALATLELGTAYHRPERSCVIEGTKGSLELDHRAATLTIYGEDGSVTVRGVFDDERANASMRASLASAHHGYNASGAAPSYWMQHAVDLEVASLIAYFRDDVPTPLTDDPAVAVEVAERALQHSCQ
jgi:predicted dehydrogenase